MENGIPNGDLQLPINLLLADTAVETSVESLLETSMETTAMVNETLMPLDLELVAEEEDSQEKKTPVDQVKEQEVEEEEEEEEEEIGDDQDGEEQSVPVSADVHLRSEDLNSNEQNLPDQEILTPDEVERQPTDDDRLPPLTDTNTLITIEDELKLADDQSNQEDSQDLKDNSDNLCSKVTSESSSSSSPFTAPMPLPSDPIARANLMRLEGNKMKEHVKKAIKSVSDYNKQINQERKDERRFSLDLQTYTFHYPIGLGLENKMLQRNVESGRCRRTGKYPVAVLPGHYQDWYRKYTSDELKYMPVNTVMYGPVISDPDMLPPVLSRFEEDSFSDSDAESELSSDHSCCCDENRCKKLKLDQNGTQGTTNKCDCNANSSSSSSDEEDDDKPPPLPILMKAYDSNEGMCYS